jgi:hypothetical protein
VIKFEAGSVAGEGCEEYYFEGGKDNFFVRLAASKHILSENALFII